MNRSSWCITSTKSVEKLQNMFVCLLFYLWIQRNVSVYLSVSENYYAKCEHYSKEKNVNQILTKIEIRNNGWNVCKEKNEL